MFLETSIIDYPLGGNNCEWPRTARMTHICAIRFVTQGRAVRICVNQHNHTHTHIHTKWQTRLDIKKLVTRVRYYIHITLSSGKHEDMTKLLILSVATRHKPGMVANHARGELNRKTNFHLSSPFAPQNIGLARQVRSSRPAASRLPSTTSPTLVLTHSYSLSSRLP